LVHAEDVAGLNRREAVFGAEVRRGERDQIGVQAVEEGDDPGDGSEPDQKAAELLSLNDLGNVNRASRQGSTISEPAVRSNRRSST